MDQWDRGPRTLIVALAVMAAALAATYWLAFPIVVRAVAAGVPQRALEIIGSETLASLDTGVLEATMLTSTQQQEIISGFRRLSLPPELASHARLEFRRSETLGANALALPSGVMVVTDGLVALATDTDDVVAVLAHEVGHLAERHSMRAIVQSALVSGLIALIVGDVSALAAAAPAALLNARYSRDLEREADAYAVNALRPVGIRPTRLADMLERMEREHTKAGRDSPTGAFSYLSTHPPTEERLKTLRGEQ
jgi:Zn-dependent protease with chaperone function